MDAPSIEALHTWRPFDPTELVRLAREQAPSELWLPQALSLCDRANWESPSMVHFVEPGARRATRSIPLRSATLGALLLDVNGSDQVIGLEFLDRLENLFLSERHAGSGRAVVLEDDGHSAWLYLCAPSSMAIESTVWAYNRHAGVTRSSLADFRGRPAPLLDELLSPSWVIAEPDAEEWTFEWSVDGEAVAVRRGSECVAFLCADLARGFSKGLTRACPWGNAWSEPKYAATFGSVVP